MLQRRPPRLLTASLVLLLVLAVVAGSQYAEKASGLEWKHFKETSHYRICTNTSSKFLERASKVAEEAFENGLRRMDVKNWDPSFIKSIERNLKPRKLVYEWDNGTRKYELKDGVILYYWPESDQQYQVVLPDGRKFSFWRNGMYGRKVTVLLCKDEKELKKALKDSVPGSPRGGWYVVEGKIAYAMDLPSDEQNLDNLVHEIGHQLTNYVLYDPPVWLDEGLAMYAGINEKGEYEEGVLRENRFNECLTALGDDKYVPIDKLIRMDYDKFHYSKNESLHYSESWALVRFLIESRDGAVHGKFQEYLEALRRGENPVEVFEKLYDPAKVEKAFRKHLTGE